MWVFVGGGGGGKHVCFVDIRSKSTPEQVPSRNRDTHARKRNNESSSLRSRARVFRAPVLCRMGRCAMSFFRYPGCLSFFKQSICDCLETAYDTLENWEVNRGSGKSSSQAPGAERSPASGGKFHGPRRPSTPWLGSAS